MKKIKGFTLVELIIVMAILAILMAAIMQMFKPIRETYIDATLYESQRNTQTGISRYISESVRFSTDMGIYTKNKVSTARGAVEAFAAEYLPANGVQTTDSNYNANVDELMKYAEIIIIDNPAPANASKPNDGNDSNLYKFNNRGWKGRLLRRKNIGNELTNTEPNAANIAKNPVNDFWRLALGSAYYGESDYSILVYDPNGADGAWTADEGLKISVSSQAKNSMKSYVDDTGKTKYATANTRTDGLIICKNQSLAGGIFDTSNYDPTSVLVPGSRVYIVFLNEKISIVP